MHPEIGCIKKDIYKQKMIELISIYSALDSSPFPVKVQLNVAVSPLVAVALRLVTNALPV